TTENPSFELNNALLSRARVYVLKALDDQALRLLLERALTDTERGLGQHRLGITDEARDILIHAADGDARRLLNLLEIAADLVEDGGSVGVALVGDLLNDTRRRFDTGGEAFSEQMSALRKPVRGSNPDASLYWYAGRLDGGCDPLYIA